MEKLKWYIKIFLQLVSGVLTVEYTGNDSTEDYATQAFNAWAETCDGTVTAGQVCRKELYVADHYGCFVKGLVYSSHPCVRVLGNSFGGNRNRIFYEVDCRTLSDGDKIEGVFELVTNGGEKKHVAINNLISYISPTENPLSANVVMIEGKDALWLYDVGNHPDIPAIIDRQ